MNIINSSKHLMSIIDSVPSAIIIVNEKGIIELANKQALKLFGYTVEELFGKTIDILVPERFRKYHPQLRESFMKNPQARPMGAGRDLFGLHQSGSEFPIEIGLNPIITDEGKYVVSAIVDITERMRATEKLRHSNEALEQSNIELQRFAYIASHDLQTPMRSVASFVDLLEMNYKEKLDPQALDWMKRIREATNHLQSLIQDLLAYSRVDSQSKPFEHVDMQDVFNHAVSLLEGSIREQNAVVTSEILPKVMGERSQLVQLMLNLIGNALKYHGSDTPRVHVTAEQKSKEWLICVRDNGIGIEPKHYDKIFEIFQRLHTQNEYPGTGIGLAVCRRVAGRHGGKIWVESEPGKGSNFYFTIAR